MAKRAYVFEMSNLDVLSVHVLANINEAEKLFRAILQENGIDEDEEDILFMIDMGGYDGDDGYIVKIGQVSE